METKFFGFLAITMILCWLQIAKARPQQQDPCQPNPCGQNSLCKTSGSSGAIACYCQPGYSQDDPDDPWACVAAAGRTASAAGGASSGPVNPLNLGSILRGSLADDVTSSTTRRAQQETTTTDRPSFLPPKETVIGMDEFGNQRIFVSASSSLDDEEEEDDYNHNNDDGGEGSRPADEYNDYSDLSTEPRRIASSSSSSSQQKHPHVDPPLGPSQNEHRLTGLSVDEIYNAECLINEDCEKDTFCDVVEKVCRDPCTALQDVCGIRSKCKVSRHRPLCYCPDDLVGNPHVECKQPKSRAGERFKK